MSLTLLASNNASTVLASSINASATTLTVNTGAGSLFPSPVSGTSFFKLTLIDAATGQLTEIVHVTARTGDVMTIERAQEGTAARVWSANDIVANMMTAGTLSYILGSFQPLDATLTALAALIGAADKLPYFNGPDTAALTPLTGVGRDIIGKATVADVLSYLQLVGELGSSTVGRLVGVQVITSSGMYTPTPGAKFGIGRGVGGGAGGGGSSTPPSGQVSSAAGGNSGSYGETKFTITGPISVTIGAGGKGGTGSASSTGANIGGAGGGTIFGTIMTCPGGSSGLASNSFTVPNVCQSIQTKTAPCTGANIVSIDGEAGGQGLAIGNGLSGRGGGNPLGSGGNHVGSEGSLSVVGNNGAGYGSGGSGAFSGSSGAGKAGGNGAPGVIIIMEYA